MHSQRAAGNLPALSRPIHGAEPSPCVRQAWDSLGESVSPIMLPPLCLEEEGRPWLLPLYPKLGHLLWDDQDIDRELYSGPCRFLQGLCQQQ